jgi:uncharacterized RDD family membrane protein YckC
MPDSSAQPAENSSGEQSLQIRAAPFWRRLASIFYDTLIVIALLMVATALLLPLNQGEAFGAGNAWLQVYLFSLVLGFFLLFWRKGGQTLGMRAWKIKLVALNYGSTGYAAPSYQQLIVRAITGALGIALMGAGLLWSLVDRDKLAVHDRLSKTRLIFLDPAGKSV